jgi:hypothetical protein
MGRRLSASEQVGALLTLFVVRALIGRSGTLPVALRDALQPPAPPAPPPVRKARDIGQAEVVE